MLTNTWGVRLAKGRGRVSGQGTRPGPHRWYQAPAPASYRVNAPGSPASRAPRGPREQGPSGKAVRCAPCSAAPVAPVARHLRPGAAPGRALCQAGPGWRDAAPRAPRGQDLESQADQVLCRRGRNSAVHSAQPGARRHIRAKARLSRTYSAAREALRGLRLRRTNPAPPRNSPSLELRWVQASRAGPRVPCCTLSPPGTPAAAGLPSSQRSRLQAATWPGRAPPSPAPGAIR